MAELSEAEQVVSERLSKIGATLRKEHFSEDNRYPTEYTITYRSIHVVQPALDLALVTLIEQLADRP